MTNEDREFAEFLAKLKNKVEEIRKDRIEDRRKDKCNQNFSQKAIVPQLERRGYHLVSEGLRVEFILFFIHCLKNAEHFGQNYGKMCNFANSRVHITNARDEILRDLITNKH